MKFLLKYLIICILFVSCKTTAQKNCSISIFNNSLQRIDSIKLTSYNLNIQLTNLLPQETVKKKFIVNYQGKYEGAFLINIYVRDTIKSRGTFGYYSNSGDIKPKYYVEILSDFSIREKIGD